METRVIRDKLLAQKALYEESVRQSEKAVQSIQEVLDSISEEDSLRVQEAVGLDCREIKQFNLERMKTDAEYLEECTAKLDKLIGALHDYLEGALGV